MKFPFPPLHLESGLTPRRNQTFTADEVWDMFSSDDDMSPWKQTKKSHSKKPAVSTTKKGAWKVDSVSRSGGRINLIGIKPKVLEGLEMDEKMTRGGRLIKPTPKMSVTKETKAQSKSTSKKQLPTTPIQKSKVVKTPKTVGGRVGRQSKVESLRKTQSCMKEGVKQKDNASTPRRRKLTYYEEEEEEDEEEDEEEKENFKTLKKRKMSASLKSTPQVS